MRPPTLSQARFSRAALHTHGEGFLRSLRSSARPETIGTYQRALREFFRWCAKDGKCRFLVPDIIRYRRYLAVRRKLSAASVSTYLTAVRRFCEYLVGTGALRGNPASYVAGNSRPSRHSRAILSPDDVDRLLGSMTEQDERGLRDYAFVKLMVGCALSEIEIVRADVGDLTLEGESGALRVQGKGHTAKDERVELSPDVRTSVVRYLALRGDADRRAPLFISAGNRTRGRRMTTRGVRDRVNSCLERAGIKQGKLRVVTPYSLRHTAAVMMAAAGATAEEIQRRMRLGSVATARLYIDRAGQVPSKPNHGTM
jgi:integrase/recombinase XerC